MKNNIFVDGQEGTTGLMIHNYLKKRTDINLIKIDESKRKDIIERKKLLNEADIAFLCLPDIAAKESVTLIDNNKTKIIDTSTAFRTSENWTYGFPELNKGQRELILRSHRISNPGCHATGFISIVYPLIKNNIITNSYPITCNSLTGYSGGGKSLISIYEENKLKNLNSPKHYALGLKHKHLAEMKKVAELKNLPIFIPIVGNFYKGMVVSVPLYVNQLQKKYTANDLYKIFSEYYKDEYFINVMPFDSAENLDYGFLNAEKCNNSNNIDIFIYGHDEQIIILARFDNLGKGASGAAIQNMNILLGINENEGLK